MTAFTSYFVRSLAFGSLAALEFVLRDLLWLKRATTLAPCVGVESLRSFFPIGCSYGFIWIQRRVSGRPCGSLHRRRKWRLMRSLRDL